MDDPNMPNMPDVQGMPGAEQANAEGGDEYPRITGMVSDMDRRLRVLEERYSNLRKKIQLTDQNMIESERSLGREIHSFSDELLELKRSTNDFTDKILVFGSELDHAAKKRDLKVIEKYLGMWNPVNYVTRKELRDYLKNNKIKLLEENDSDSQK
jgi:hypothetical protein